MILLGLTVAHKQSCIEAYCRQHGIDHVVMLSPARFDFSVGAARFRSVDWPEIQMYRTFYPLLQEIDGRTLVVVNECLREQNRHSLTFNCIRHFLSQTQHVLVFQWLPCIDTMSDFMTMFDFATGSKWKREKYDVDMLAEVTVHVFERTPVFRRIDVATDAKTKSAYEAQRTKLFADQDMKDPHVIPRTLHLVGGKTKAAAGVGRALVARNARVKPAALFGDETPEPGPYTVLEFPHRFIDFADFMHATGQTEFDVLVADLRVDDWYFNRFQEWAGRISNGYADLRQFSQRARRGAQAA